MDCRKLHCLLPQSFPTVCLQGAPNGRTFWLLVQAHLLLMHNPGLHITFLVHILPLLLVLLLLLLLQLGVFVCFGAQRRIDCITLIQFNQHIVLPNP